MTRKRGAAGFHQEAQVSLADVRLSGPRAGEPDRLTANGPAWLTA